MNPSRMSFEVLMCRLCDPVVRVEPIDRAQTRFVFVMRRVEL